jgi:hypothetical protein
MYKYFIDERQLPLFEYLDACSRVTIEDFLEEMPKDTISEKQMELPFYPQQLDFSPYL